MTAAELVAYLRSRNVSVWLENEQIRYRGPKDAVGPELIERLRELKPELHSYLADEEGTHRPDGTDLLSPVTAAQESLLILDELADGSPADSVRMAHRIHGELDVGSLEQAFDIIARRHASLRTSFSFGADGFMQKVQPSVKIPIRLVDLSGEDRDFVEQHLQRLLTEEGGMPFDLTSAPLIRVSLYRLALREHVLQVVFHHAVGDGWSTQLISEELATLYPSPRDSEARLPALPVSYLEHARREKRALALEPAADQLRYWVDRLQGLEPLRLPTDKRRPAVPSFRGRRSPIAVSAELLAEVREVGRRQGATPYMVLMAAFATLLHRYSGDADVAVGMPVSTRQPDVEKLIGMFLSVLVLRVDMSGNPTFRELLTRIRAATLEAFANRDAPFEKVVAAVQPDRDTSRNPLFQVMLQLSEGQALKLPGLSTTPQDHDPCTSQFDMTLHLYQANDGLTGYFEYSTDLFEEPTMRRMGDHLVRIMRSMVDDPDQTVGSFSLQTEPEEKLAAEWNATEVNYPVTTLKELFEDQVSRTPDAIALVFGEESRTYSELNSRANQLANYLAVLGVGPEARVGIFMERSLEMMEAIYAVVKAGGGYVPLDPDYPRGRILQMMEDSEIEVVITQDHLRRNVPVGDHRLVTLGRDWARISEFSDRNPSSAVGPDNLAYIIFTSGSTGRPKGVMNEHRGVCNRILWTQDAFQLAEDDRVLQKTPISFDVSVWELFWPLIVGSRLVIADPGGHRDPQYLKRLIEREGITTLHFVPSMLNQFLDTVPSAAETASIRRVICSGEALPKDLQDKFFRSVDTELHNLYGPTEAAVDVTWWACDRESRLDFVPIGKPVSNTQMYVVDENMQRCPVGVPGELLIGGVQVARGYVNRDDLTRERFIPDAFGGGRGAKLYRTGDLAKFLPDGNIQYLGRTDNQIKLRGFRIELGEIEAVLSQHVDVQQVVVELQEFGVGDGRLIAYVLPESSPPSVSSLRDFLHERVPDYMVPAVFVMLDSIPFLANGKVDRQALPEPAETRPELDAAFQAPRTTVEATIADIWRDLLRIDEVGVHDNFFDLGGNSLLLMQLRSRLQHSFETDVPVLELFRHPTVGRLSEFITVGGEEASLQDAEDRAGKQQAALQRLRRSSAAKRGPR